MATIRRNGQLSSCEPCRKSKLRCDHKTPTCDRCLRRGKVNDCYYHPAPLTRPPQPQTFSPKEFRRPRRSRSKNKTVFRINEEFSSSAPESSTATTPQDDLDFFNRHIAQLTSLQKWPVAPGHLSLNLRGDILNEYQDPSERLGEENHDQVRCRNDAPGEPDETPHVQLGAQILLHMDKIRWFDEVLILKNKISEGWVFGAQITRHLCLAIEVGYNNRIQGTAEKQTSLLRWSAEVFRNTRQKIISTNSMSLQQYLSIIAGRWEVIGLLFALLGTATFQVPEDDSIFTRNPWNIDSKQLRSLSMALSELCYKFCNNTGLISDPVCWLAIQQTVLLSLTAGVNDFRTWQKLGDLSTIVYAIGLLRPNNDSEEECPFFLSEIRKRGLVCAYSMDKELATALGLPPRICSRYLNLELPLDLSYDELIAPPSELEQALQRLDINGWNTKNKLTSEARLRLAFLTSCIREKILELSTKRGTDDLLEGVESLIEESHQTQEALPPFFRWNANESGLEMADEAQSFTHLEFSFQEFLSYRVLLKRLKIKCQGLIDTAHEIISTLLHIVHLRTRAAQSVYDMSWDLCYMGLPAAGILTTELLVTEPASELIPAHSRAEIIEKLRAIVSHMRSVQIPPDESIYKIVQQGAHMICKALDETHSIHSSKSEQPISSTLSHDQTENWLENGYFDANNDDFMSWLDNLDWGQDPWLQFS